MAMLIERTKIPKCIIITPDVYTDERGYFKETCNPFMQFKPLQANQSISKKGVIRGLHEQDGANKLVWVAKGSIYDVCFDKYTGEWVSVELSADNHKQLFVPAGKFHGFQALEDDTVVCYLMSQFYDPLFEHGFNPEFIDWPLSKEEWIISDKDRKAPKWKLNPYVLTNSSS